MGSIMRLFSFREMICMSEVESLNPKIIFQAQASAAGAIMSY